ncbi:hypothetical protein UK23_21490 [Lentzea aerocolonigenes]|uniref:PPE family domain-containing protein n=1 Tax=Lentzea aerocolonigenes TaxID=68170 RepID=A0A0F0H090_LENAE|nr:hypothetical protein UK23_21490 [Lentzea aerocolonigenes]
MHFRYGLRQHTQAQTGQEIHVRVGQEMKDRYGPFLGAVLGWLEAPVRMDELLDAQALRLKQACGLTRQAPGAPGVHYLAIPHRELHDMVNNGVAPAVVGGAGDTYTQIGNDLAAFVEEVATAIGASEKGWQGTAGDGARKALAAIANHAAEVGTAAQLAGTLHTQQSAALANAKYAVPEPPAQPLDQRAISARLMATTDPVQFVQQAPADYAAFQQQQRDHQQAARVVETYDRTLTQTTIAQPAFAPRPQAPPKDPIDPGRPPIAPNPGFTGRGNMPPRRVGNEFTDMSWTVLPTPNTGGTDTSGLNNNRRGNGANLGNQFGGDNNLNLGAPLPGQTSASGSTQGGPDRRAGGGAGFGLPNVVRDFGPGASAGVMPGVGSTAGRGGATSGGVGGRGGAGGGAMGGTGTGAAKGKGSEDLERTTPSYLVNEHNGDEIVGDLGMVAPPVIGG